MTDIKDILERALPDTTPPTRITRDAMVAVGRSRQRRRRAGVALGTGALVTAIAVGAVAVLPESTPSGIAPANTHPTATTPPSTPDDPVYIGAPPPSPLPPEPKESDYPPLSESMPGLKLPPANPRPFTESRDRAKQRLSDALRGEITPLLPAGGRMVAYQPATQPFEMYGSQGELKSWADLVDAGGSGGEVWLNVGRATGVSRIRCDVNLHLGGVCNSRVGPHGEYVEIRQYGIVDGPVEFLVFVIKPDGTSWMAEIRNYRHGQNPVGARVKSNTVTQRIKLPPPPISGEQLVAILLKPEFTLYP